MNVESRITSGDVGDFGVGDLERQGFCQIAFGSKGKHFQDFMGHINIILENYKFKELCPLSEDDLPGFHQHVFLALKEKDFYLSHARYAYSGPYRHQFLAGDLYKKL